MKGMSRMSNAFITVSSLMSFFTARFRIVFFTYTKYRQSGNKHHEKKIDKHYKEQKITKRTRTESKKNK
jgi:hypothetical protein